MKIARGCRVAVWTALLGSVLAAGGGCVIILPTIPANVPGCGVEYRLVDERGDRAPEVGLLLMKSHYRDGQLDLVQAFPVKDGAATVPRKTDVRYQDFGIGCMFSPIPYIYIGWFGNPKDTHLYPLVPGYVPTGWPNPDLWEGTVRAGEPPRTILHVMKADGELERKYLEEATLSYRSDQGGDKAALEQARAYVCERTYALERNAGP
jgi:hypothetical protein